MRVAVNGEDREVADDCSVAQLADELGAAPKGVAVAVNGGVVSQGAWAGHHLREGDRVEVLGAMQGG